MSRKNIKSNSGNNLKNDRTKVIAVINFMSDFISESKQNLGLSRMDTLEQGVNNYSTESGTYTKFQ